MVTVMRPRHVLAALSRLGRLEKIWLDAFSAATVKVFQTTKTDEALRSDACTISGSQGSN